MRTSPAFYYFVFGSSRGGADRISDMRSWIFRNRARLATIYGLRAKPSTAAEAPRPGAVQRTGDGVILGPWGRRAG